MQVSRASPEHLEKLAILFDQYRVFYGQPSDVDSARAFLRARLDRHESVIFIALDADAAAGFTQLYPSFSSVAMAPVWILNDLFVAPGFRRRGVAKLLMDAAARHAAQTGAIRVELETQAENRPAQALYEQLGYTTESGFRHYALAIPTAK